MRWPFRAPHASPRTAEAADALESAIRGEPADPGIESLADVARLLDVAASLAPVSPRADEIRLSVLGRLDDPDRPPFRLAPVLLASLVALVLGVGAIAAAPALGDLVVAPVRTLLDALLDPDVGPPETPSVPPSVPDAPPAPDEPSDSPSPAPTTPVATPAAVPSPPDAGPPGPMPTPDRPTPPATGPPSDAGPPDPMPTPRRTPPIDPGPPADPGPP